MSDTAAKPNRTSLPWKIAESGDEVFVPDEITICTADGKRSILDIVGSTEIDTANAAFIVRAGNAHDDLVSALSALLDIVQSELEADPEPNDLTGWKKAISAGEKALAKAG